MTDVIQRKGKSRKSSIGLNLGLQGMLVRLLESLSTMVFSLSALPSLRLLFLFYFGKMYGLTGPRSVNWQWTSSSDDLRRPRSLYLSIFHPRPWISSLMSMHLQRSDGEVFFLNYNRMGL